jgi:hypothetical protein
MSASSIIWNKLAQYSYALIKKALMPNTLMNKLLRVELINTLDEKFIDIRVSYLKWFMKFEEEFIQYPRVVKSGFFEGLTLHKAAQKNTPPCWHLKGSYLNPEFIRSVNGHISAMWPSTIDEQSQILYSDIWDHLTYGLMVATGAAELGNIGGTPGCITKAKLAYMVGEGAPGSKSRSQGPFGIYSPEWSKLGSGIEPLPNNNFYVQGSHFFYKASYCHKMILKINKGWVPSFMSYDPQWLVELYKRGDLLSYILLFRRFYGGTGDWGLIIDHYTGKYLNRDSFAQRVLAFAITVMEVCDIREYLDKSYPTSHSPRSEYDSILAESEPIE